MPNYLSDGVFRMPDSWYDPPEYPDPIDCPDCGGSGQVKNDNDEMDDCERCDGEGAIEPEPYEPDPDDARDRWLDQQREEMEGL